MSSDASLRCVAFAPNCFFACSSPPVLRGFVSASYHNYAGSANADSPLLRSDDGYSAALGLSWSFLRSKQAAVVE